MGNALRFLYGQCCKAVANSDLLGAHDTSATAVGVATLARDLNHYETTSQVPEGLNKHVVSSKKAQANWYKKISVAWRDSKPPPKTAEEASNLIILTLKRHQKADVEGLLAFYGLPLTQGPKFELQTLPVDAKAVADGDTITVYVNTVDENARKYRIRLRGIDAPESSMPYGKEAKEALTKIVLGKSLKVLVFEEDRYGRFVGDIYCNGKFIQETMLKKGLAWHYKAYDQRPELEKWEKAARAKRVGLWASSNPEKPWEWRKDRREGR